MRAKFESQKYFFIIISGNTDKIKDKFSVKDENILFFKKPFQFNKIIDTIDSISLKD